MYEIKFRKKALNFFNKLDKPIQEQIGNKIEKLKKDPFLGKPLVGNLSGLFSLRINKYRIIYHPKKEELIILVLDIGHRKNIY